jgi:hypothetical protein
LGKPLEVDRDYTEIEIGLLEHLMKGIISPMKTVWRDYLEIAPRLMKIETNARILQGIGADEKCRYHRHEYSGERDSGKNEYLHSGRNTGCHV